MQNVVQGLTGIRKTEIVVILLTVYPILLQFYSRMKIEWFRATGHATWHMTKPGEEPVMSGKETRATATNIWRWIAI